MKTQNNKFVFKTKGIIELSSDNLESINGGTQLPTIVVTTVLFHTK